MSNIYFANKQGSELVQEILSRVSEYDEYVRNSGALSRVSAVYEQYYGIKNGSLRIGSSGEAGEIKNLCVNDFRAIIQHMLVITTQNKLAFEVGATNSDYEAQSQCLLGKAIVQYENEDKGLNALIRNLVEGAILYGEHFVSVRWNRDGGEPVAADLESNREVMSGAMEYKLHHMIDVIRDPSLQSNQQQKWNIVREKYNKYDLAAQYPEFEEEILAGGEPSYKLNKLSFNGLFKESEDSIEVITLYHDQTPACKRGRQVIIVGDTIVEDRPLPYRRLPVYRLAAANIDNTILGYSVAFDLVGPQLASDALLTAAFTNNVTFALQNIWCQDPNMKMSDIGDGLNLITSQTPPQAIALTQSSPELYKLLDLLQGYRQLLSGVNSTTRGAPEASLKSGASLALVASQAIQFMSGLQNAYAELAGSVGTAIIETLQKYATAPQLISITGKTKRSMIKVFSNKDLSKIRKVSVRLGSALIQTTAGKIELANQMLQSGLIKDPKQYLSVVETGTLDSLDEVDISELMLARSENELLQDGVEVIALLIDEHIAHILSHKSVLNDPEVRKNPTLVQAIMNHIQEHIDLLRKVPADLAQVIGTPLLPSQQVDPNMVPPTDQPQGMPSMPSLPEGSPEALEGAYSQVPAPMNVKP